MTSPAAEHERQADDLEPVRCAVLTISDTRTEHTDESGPLIERQLGDHGHLAVARAIVLDEPEAILAKLESWIADPEVQVVITTGGTGVARRDRTVEVVRPVLTVELEGFGELFRMLSFKQVGPAAMLSRAVAGLVERPPDAGGDTFVFALPGSRAAVELAMTELIGPQLAHLLWPRRPDA